jgi:transcriptional regulator with XRE-family HTH domain
MRNKDLSKALGYEPSMITQVMNGEKNMSPEKAKLAGRLLNVDPFVFMKGGDVNIRRRLYTRPEKVA